LNPKFHYNKATFSTHPEVHTGLYDVIERMTEGSVSMHQKIIKEMEIFTSQGKNFGRDLARHALYTQLPSTNFGVNSIVCNFPFSNY
jgi:hypothetical protein